MTRKPKWRPTARHLHSYRPTICPLWDDEVNKLEARAIAFCDRWKIEFTGHPCAIDAIEKYLEVMWESGAPAFQDRGKAWRTVLRRSTSVAEAFDAYGVEFIHGRWTLVGRPWKKRRCEVQEESRDATRAGE